MRFEKLNIPGLIVVHLDIFKDNRGSFTETYSLPKFREGGIGTNFIQDNHSVSSPSTLRGLHFQLPPFDQAKLVRCPRGSVFDVVVDLRHGSPTFKQWTSVILSEENKDLFFIPRGFAHGFLVLGRQKQTDFMYKVDNLYNRTSEGGFRYDDPEVNIKWPKRRVDLSEKDKKWPYLREIINDLPWDYRQP